MIEDINLIDTAIRCLADNKDTSPFIVQIGAMDGVSYDDLVAHITQNGWVGLYVEPIPYYFNKLVEYRGPGNLFEQSAIVSSPGVVEMVYMDPAIIETLPPEHRGFSGMSSLFPIKNGMRDDLYMEHRRSINVSGITLGMLFAKHNIRNVDIFLCDAEGYDWEVFSQLDLSEYQPKIIRIEHLGLVDEEKQKVISKLTDFGYEYTIGAQDIDAVSHEMMQLLSTWNDPRVSSVPANDLTEIFKRNKTDKYLSGYDYYYKQLFNPIRYTTTSLLEIGIGTQISNFPSTFIGVAWATKSDVPAKPGASLRSWRDYFENAAITGIDPAEDCKITDEERIETHIISSLDKFACENTFRDEQFDIIIDDGLHTAIAQLQTLINYFPKVKQNGLYIIEDCGGGGEGEHPLVEYKTNFEKILSNHTYVNLGNIIIVRKDNSGAGLVGNFDEFISTVSESTQVSTVEIARPQEVTKDLTVVSGLWNINRIGRDFDFYIDRFIEFLSIPVNMYLYIPQEMEELVWKYRSPENTAVKVLSLDDIKNNYYAQFWDNTQAIRASSEWLSQSGWIPNSPQASNEWYNSIVQSKMFMLHDARVVDPFGTDYFIWLDAGITNTVPTSHLVQDRVLDKIIPYLNTFLFLSYPYVGSPEIHGFEIESMNRFARQPVEYVCRGGLFGGHKEYITNANSTYYALLDQTLSSHLMGTEESLFTIMSYLEPHIYKRYVLDDNGLIVKFTERLLNGTVELVTPTTNAYNAPKSIYFPAADKTSLYVLSFNFPDQFKALVESFQYHPEWLNKPRKILIDNTLDQDIIAQYDKLCAELGFEHIITGKNLGINRGRQYAADHFHESDSDYYLFFEDDMMLHKPTNVGTCRNGFRQFVPNLFTKIHHIMAREQFDFLKLSFTEVYMDNNIQVSWYNVPQSVRTEIWSEYDKLPISGLDPYAPRTKFDVINVYEDLAYISGNIYYANWPMIVSRAGNQKMFIDTKWDNPFEQTWMSYMFQETRKGNLHPAVLLASPINHNRIHHYAADVRREN